MTDVVTLGSATFDAFLTTEKRFKEIKLGEKVLVSTMNGYTGGGATNSAAALATMGLAVKCLTKVGNDEHGHIVLRELKEKYGVGIIQTKYSTHATSFSAIVHSLKEKDRVIFTYKGASDDLSWNDFDHNQLQARWIYMGTLLGEAWKTALQIAEYAKRHDINLLFNPSSYLAKKGKKFLAQMLHATTLLVLNKEEAQAVLGLKLTNMKELAKKLTRLGPKIVAITDGEHGVWVYDGQELLHEPALNVNVVHTAGAGDAFTSGFLAGIIKKHPLRVALKVGIANAASVITKLGAKNGLLTWKEALRFKGR